MVLKLEVKAIACVYSYGPLTLVHVSDTTRNNFIIRILFFNPKHQLKLEFAEYKRITRIIQRTGVAVENYSLTC